MPFILTRRCHFDVPDAAPICVAGLNYMVNTFDVFAATSIVTLYVTVKVQSTAARMRVTFDFMPPLLGFVCLNAKYPSSARIRAFVYDYFMK